MDVRETIPGNHIPEPEALVGRDVFDVTGARLGRARAWDPEEGQLDVALGPRGRDALQHDLEGLSIPMAFVATVREDGIHLGRTADELLGR